MALNRACNSKFAENWNILSRNRTCTVTDFNLLRNYFLQGYPSEEKDKKKKPYALPHTHSLHASTFETAVARISYKRYLQKTTDFETARVQPGYYATINQANPIHATPEMEQIEPRDSVTEQGTEQGSETIVHSKCALSPHMLVITAPSVKPRGFDCPLRL